MKKREIIFDVPKRAGPTASEGAAGGSGLSGEAASYLAKQRKAFHAAVVGRALPPAVPRLPAAAIPRMAAGGVVPPNRSFLAVLGDNTRETEIVSPLSAMKQAVTEALREAGGLPDGSVTLTVNLDGREIARNQVDHINDMTRAAGRPVLLY